MLKNDKCDMRLLNDSNDFNQPKGAVEIHNMSAFKSIGDIFDNYKGFSIIFPWDL